MKVPTKSDSDEVTARLDAVYSDEPSSIAAEFIEAQRRALTTDDPPGVPVTPRLASGG